MGIDAPETRRRLETLRALKLTSLPSWRSFAADVLAAPIAGGLALLLFVTWRDTSSFAALYATIALAVLCVRSVVRAWSGARVLWTARLDRARPAGDRLDLALELGTAVLVRDVETITEAASEALAATDALPWLSGRSGKLAAKARERIADCLEPGETTLAAIEGSLFPRAWRYPLVFVSLGLLGVYWSRRGRLGSGVLAVTDSRVVFRRRRRAELLLDEPLSTVRIDAWKKARMHQSVFLLRLHDGTGVRFAASTPWRAAELRRAFELIASTADEPPPLLTRFWQQTAA
jgi:hypothetical protein